MKKYILMLMSVALFMACSDDKDTETIENQSISLNTEVVEFDGAGNALAGTSSVTVTSSAEWRIVGDTSWCTPSVEKGGNGTTVSFNVDAAVDPEATRSVNLVFICGDAAVKLAVRQVPSPSLEFIKVEEPYTMASAGGGIVIKVKTNVETFDYETTEDWVSLIHYPTNSGTSEKWIQFGVETNSTFYDRDATVTLFKGTPVETTIRIEQSRFVGIILQSEAALEFGAAGGTATVTAVSNVDFVPTFTTADGVWLSATEDSSEGTDVVTKTFTLTCQPSEFPRTGTVTLKPTSGASIAISVNQVNPDQAPIDIPDQLFASYLKSNSYITEKDDKYYMTYKGYTATTIAMSSGSYANVASIEGVEHFENITSFTLYYCGVRKVDLSKNTKLTRVTATNMPLEELILGDLNITSFSMTYTFDPYYNKDNSSKYFKLSSSKCTSLTLNLTSSYYSENDKLEYIDITEATALTTLKCNRVSGKLKKVYVTQAQKDAYDAGTLTITASTTYPVEVVVK